jgi:hypothetical protein
MSWKASAWAATYRQPLPVGSLLRRLEFWLFAMDLPAKAAGWTVPI